MTLQEILNKIDKTDKKGCSYADIELFCTELQLQNINYYPDFENKMKKFWIYSWCCTDTWVGLSAYFFEDEFVCLSFQQGRKCSEEFEWASEEAIDKVRKYILSLISLEKSQSKIIDINSDFNLDDLVNEHKDVTYSVFNLKK